jgi:hypothetical protein
MHLHFNHESDDERFRLLLEEFSKMTAAYDRLAADVAAANTSEAAAAAALSSSAALIRNIIAEGVANGTGPTEAQLNTLADELEANAGTLTGATAEAVAADAAAPAEAPLTVSPTSITGTAGAEVTGELTVTGGIGPYTAVSSLGDIVLTGLSYDGTPAVAETGTITVTDSTTPPNSVTVDVTISASAE